MQHTSDLIDKLSRKDEFLNTNFDIVLWQTNCEPISAYFVPIHRIRPIFAQTQRRKSNAIIIIPSYTVYITSSNQ